ncbi:flagellar hook protein FlgE [soil metagenome]
MTLGNSLWIGVSGLIAHGEAMSTVGDNIANVSTIGFKKERASFNDILGGEFVNNRGGGGAYLGANQTLWQQGTLTQTGNPMDVGINGQGMFVVSGQHLGRDQQYLTRDGRFQLDSSGMMVDQHGMHVQGYTVTNGTKSSLGDLNLGKTLSPALPTTTAKIAMNLKADPTHTLSPFDPNDPKTVDYKTSIQVTDSLGKSHQVTLQYVNNGGGQFDVHATVDGSDIGGAAGTQVEIGTGTMSFNTDGSLQVTNPDPMTFTTSFTNATPGQAVTLDYGSIAAGGTGREGAQMSSNDSTTASVDVDGHGAGSLTDVKINPNGSIEGVFDNGDSFEIGRLAIADVQNYEGLSRQGDSLYTTSRESGQAVIDEAGTGGRGATMSGTLEQSNVDISSELVTMIAYQRAFQANGKTVSTADEMMQEVVNLKR